MVISSNARWIASASTLVMCSMVCAQQPGSIRGVVSDQDFDAPLPAALVTIAETGQTATTTDEGNFVFPQVAPGTYTLIFSKDGYARQVRSNVVVVEGQLTDADSSLAGDFTDMEEFVAQDIQIGGSEAGLLKLRLDSPALIDSIGADLMSRAGAGDAASALRLVAGATVQDGKFAVIRGLPDRYVNSQINGVRLPTADEDKRAVQLDQFPSAAIESIQVSKTFTPDQQGDASGGAVNVVLKGIPDESIFQFRFQTSYNSNVSGRDDFLSYRGGGVDFWGRDSRDQQLDLLGQNWEGAAGVSPQDSPFDYKWSLAAGGKHDINEDWKIGGFASFFYERFSSFFDDGIDDSYWVRTPGGPMVPATTQGDPSQGEFKTKLYDVTQATEGVQWGGLGTVGIEHENHSFGLTYLYTHIAEDTATLSEDTRGKEYFFPGYDPNDPTGIGNSPETILAAPYLRLETLEYTERTTSTIQLDGKHRFPTDGLGLGEFFQVTAIELDWIVSNNTASLYQPDKRQFASLWQPESFNPGFPPFSPPFTSPSVWLPYKPAENFTLGNFQRIWKEIDEDSTQYALNLKLPFTQWTDSEGYFKFGIFDDTVDRTYNQDTFSNFNDNTAQFFGDFDDFWSEFFPFEDHPITDGPPLVDVDYEGQQSISAWYAMADVPLTEWLNIIGGARFESTDIGIVNDPEPNALWIPPGETLPTQLLPGQADVDYQQDDVLPSIGFVLQPIEKVTFRGAYSQTVARQTFKELTPIQQQEYLGADVFIGNPELRMSALDNYDLRLDYAPYEGSLFSVSWFKKDIVDPIEYVQRISSFTYTTPVNYPKGELSGFEFEARQDLGRIWKPMTGFSIGANATFIDSEVTLSAEESAQFDAPSVQAPISSRDMTGAPEFLYNIFLTYDFERTGTQFSLFYTVQGDTLVAGAGVSENAFVPDVYALEYNTLNLSLSQKLGDHFKLVFQVKNLLDPEIEEVYRSKYIGSDVLKTSYTKGIEFSIGISAEFTF